MRLVKTMENKNIIKFRILQVYSPITFEKLNIGIVIEHDDLSYEIKKIDNLEIYAEFFPMFSLKSINNSLKYLNLKSIRKKLTSKGYKVTSTLYISDIKIYQKQNDEDLSEYLMAKYITLYKTNRYINDIIYLLSQKSVFTEYKYNEILVSSISDNGNMKKIFRSISILRNNND